MTPPQSQPEPFASASAILASVAIPAVLLKGALVIIFDWGLAGSRDQPTARSLRASTAFITIVACLLLSLIPVNAYADTSQDSKTSHSSSVNLILTPAQHNRLKSLSVDLEKLIDEIKEPMCSSNDIPPCCQNSPLESTISLVLQSQQSGNHNEKVIRNNFVATVRALVRRKDFECAFSLIEKIKCGDKSDCCLQQKSLYQSVVRAQIRASLSGRISCSTYNNASTPCDEQKCKTRCMKGK